MQITFYNRCTERFSQMCILQCWVIYSIFRSKPLFTKGYIGMAFLLHVLLCASNFTLIFKIFATVSAFILLLSMMFSEVCLQVNFVSKCYVTISAFLFFYGVAFAVLTVSLRRGGDLTSYSSRTISIRVICLILVHLYRVPMLPTKFCINQTKINMFFTPKGLSFIFEILSGNGHTQFY